MAGLWGQMSEHERVKGLLSPYLDGRVSKAERALVERHLTSCADCARDLATLRVTVAAVREMPRVRAPRSFALPRSTARQPRATPWAYPLLRGATAIATFLFAVVLGMDLFARSATLPTAAPQIAAPAALPPTLVAMQPAATIAPTSAPPVPTQQAETFAATSAPQALSAAPALATATPSAAAKAAPPAVATAPAAVEAAPQAAIVEPPAGQAIQDAGLGGAPPPAPSRAAAGQVALTPAAQPTPIPALPGAPEPTQIARAPEPQPPAAPLREGAYPAQPPAVNPLRIAEGALAVLALALGVAAWIARRRSR